MDLYLEKLLKKDGNNRLQSQTSQIQNGHLIPTIQDTPLW